jgi:minor histocompatibility antigen H13
MSEPGLVAQLMGRVAFGFSEIQPFLPTYLHIILAAIFPIVTAAHASLSRPASAAKPRKDGKQQDGSDDDEEEDEYQRMEGLAPSDALLFPLYAGLALTSLYYLIKWLQDPAILNKMLNWYFGVVGLYGVCKFISDALRFAHSLVFPTYYVGSSGLWHVDQTNHKALLMATDESQLKTSDSPLPGILSLLPLPGILIKALWKIRGLSKASQKLTVRFYIHKLAALRAHFDAFNIIGILLGLFSVLYFNFIDKKWWLTNLMGFSFSYSALQLMSPTTFTTGGLLLIGLFLYDIYMVFYTPMMVTVAKSLDIPIKLLFPRPSTTQDGDTPPIQEFAMLGLGDIVLPGLLIALALRYDLYLHYLGLQKKRVSTPEPNTDVVKHDAQDKQTIVKAPYAPHSKYWSSRLWTGRGASLPIISNGSFKKTYFFASLTGYILGMIVTLLAMHLSAHPQPALLYLVPGVLGSLMLTALIRGETTMMWGFSEEEEDLEETTTEAAKQDGKKEKVAKRSIFSLSRDETDSPIIRAANKLVDKAQDLSSAEEDEKQNASQPKVERLEQSVRRSRDRELIHFSISKYKPPRRGGKLVAKDEKTNPKWVESKTIEKDGVVEHRHVSKKLRTA